jgi:DNA repair protein RadD
MIPVCRNYQAAAIDACRAHVSAGVRRILLCAPCGSGKTVLSSAIIHSARAGFSARVLFVVDRVELINQTVRQLARWGVTEVGVIRADDERTNPLMPVQVATIQTLNRRALPAADIVFCDEAHLAAGASWRKMIEFYPDATILGLTATPTRLDGKPLGDIFEVLHLVAPYSRMIEDHHIVAPRCFGVEHAPDLSKVKTVVGDYDLKGLEDALCGAQVLGDTVSEYQARAEGRRTVVFAVTVAHSRALAQRFADAGVRVAHVDANTPEEERADVGRRLRAGELDVLCNVSVLSTGWDEPCVKCMILARPTKSLSLYLQMSGRVLRPWNEFTPPERSWLPEDGPSLVPILIDQGENIDRFGSPHADRKWSLTSAAEMTEKKPTRCIKCRAYIKHYPCPECGYAPPVTPREVREAPDVKIGERTFVDPMRALFDKSLKEAQKKGFKPGYASAKVKEAYGDWPPWAWSQAVKAEYAKDEDWQERVAQRALDRERWQASKPAEPVAEAEAAPIYQDDSDIPF